MHHDDDTTTAGNGAHPSVGEAARKVGEGLGQLGQALQSSRQGIVEPLAQFVQEQPIKAAAIALGVGYVLGGGLFTRTTGRVLAIAWRLGGMALAKNFMTSLADPSGFDGTTT